MIKKIRNLSIYSISNFISVIGPLTIVPLLINLLSKESYAEMVSGQLAFFYSTVIVSFGLISLISLYSLIGLQSVICLYCLICLVGLVSLVCLVCLLGKATLRVTLTHLRNL